ncbi:Kunitz-type trypsin inhibitor KTI1 [Senna tora]|uniref:Kunitz-type trypsin inhibitor KTI1 n=1 Tax=Senna tora TaxID=362788 RepID=A0A834WBS7_9FABA|nr:Kunitz-type trypsin inhibitor KTI1 [Senna tora]
METNGTYMLLATPQFGAGGIETVAISHDAIHAPCALAVVEGESNNNSTGLHVTFTPCHDSKPTDYVTTSSCLHQQFHLGVLTGGSDAIGGSSFYIKPSKSAGAAKYTYWLNCDNHIFGYCDGVGVKKDKGLNRLFLLHGQYHDPLLLQFHKVHDHQKDASTPTKTTMMKYTTPILSLFFLLFAFTTATATATEQTVYDSDGDAVLPGGIYYIVPLPSPNPGGIVATDIWNDNNDTCKVALVKTKFPYSGYPVKITSFSEPPVVTTSSHVCLSFVSALEHVCTEYSFWAVESDSVMVDAVGSLFYIKDSGIIGNEYTYKLVFCSGHDFGLCLDVGIYSDSQGNDRLVLGKGKTMVFKIVKASEHSDKISMVV